MTDGAREDFEQLRASMEDVDEKVAESMGYVLISDDHLNEDRREEAS